MVGTGGLDFGALGLRVRVGRGPKLGMGFRGTGAADNGVGCFTGGCVSGLRVCGARVDGDAAGILLKPSSSLDHSK